MTDVLVVQNTPTGGPGRVGEVLAETGLTVEVTHAYEGQPVPRKVEHGAVVVLGGGYLPDEDARAPWLADLRALTTDALQAGTPVLGICLGGQLLAHVAGGSVAARHGRPEVGSTPLTVRPEAARDPLFGALPPRVTAIENHEDQITALPPDAVWLMESADCPHQAFRVGDRAWGVQFHPEAPPSRLRGWDLDRLSGLGLDHAALCARAESDDAEAAPLWTSLVRRFADLVPSGR
ncbi:type 1 glutamine amidotransferase [Streptomyces sp. NPDC048172]|uniref:type 1 glutamine amidotransferase n=1 Tax=Streptomyces sp. NPDC048172 TaxID=3365505 RepID=UPI00371EE2C6